METTYLTVPNTEENLNQVKQTVAEHMIEKCLTEEQVKAYAVQAIVDSYDMGLYTIGSLARLVKDTPPNNEGCYVPQLPYALYSGTGVDDFSGDINHYFFTREESIQYSALEVKEEVRHDV
jgi:hypothetical protein